MKSVPNLISYLHEFFQNFYHFLDIYLELFSFEMIFNSEITDSGPHLSDAACRAVARGLKPLFGQRTARLDSPTSCAPPSPRPPRADRPTARQRPPARLAARAAVPTAAVRSRIARTAAPATSPLTYHRRAAPPSPCR
jgi:hypothetical protein